MEWNSSFGSNELNKNSNSIEKDEPKRDRFSVIKKRETDGSSSCESYDEPRRNAKKRECSSSSDGRRCEKS